MGILAAIKALVMSLAEEVQRAEDAERAELKAVIFPLLDKAVADGRIKKKLKKKIKDEYPEGEIDDAPETLHK
jgi:hypothetical protein